LLISVRAGGTGLTLTEASYVVHFDQWWNPAVSRQAEDRVHRKGQKATSVNIYEFWMANTIEERIHAMLKEKGELTERVIDSLASPEDLETQFSINDLLGIFDLAQNKEGGVEKRNSSVQQSNRESDSPTTFSLSLTEIQQKLFALTPFEFEKLVA